MLADCLMENFDASCKSTSIRKALLQYSKMHVPEGKALYVLSFGSKDKQLLAAADQFVDIVFGGNFGLGENPFRLNSQRR